MIQNYIYMKMYNDIYIYIIHNMCPRKEKPNTFMPQVMLSKKGVGGKCTQPIYIIDLTKCNNFI
jgi:hypothetical protein